MLEHCLLCKNNGVGPTCLTSTNRNYTFKHLDVELDLLSICYVYGWTYNIWGYPTICIRDFNF